jgi:hypothetical protein
MNPPSASGRLALRLRIGDAVARPAILGTKVVVSQENICVFMRGLSPVMPTLVRFRTPRRPSSFLTCWLKDVDARHKAGHDR